MAKENPLWGAERIRGEPLKLGIKVCKKSGQTWATFLKNHAADIWACDFTVVHDLLFRPLYIFVIIEHTTRRIIHTAVTSSPTNAWTAQQVREATPWRKGPKFLIRDRDNKYGQQFRSVARSTGIQELKTPFRAPRANAICERCIGSLKRECLGQMLIIRRNQLSRIVKEYTDYYNHSRPHQGIGQRIPARFNGTTPSSLGKIISTPVLGGLHHSYSRAAHPH